MFPRPKPQTTTSHIFTETMFYSTNLSTSLSSPYTVRDRFNLLIVLCNLNENQNVSSLLESTFDSSPPVAANNMPRTILRLARTRSSSKDDQTRVVAGNVVEGVEQQ